MATKQHFTSFWLLMGTGVALIALGIFSFMHPLYAFIKIAAYAGVVLLADGFVLAILSGRPVGKKLQTLLAAESAVNFFFAILLCFNPLFSLIVLPLVIGCWLVATGLLKLLASLVLRKSTPAWLMVGIAGSVALLFGILLLYNPSARANGLLLTSGACWLLMGVLYMIDAFRFKNEDGGLSIML